MCDGDAHLELNAGVSQSSGGSNGGLPLGGCSDASLPAETGDVEVGSLGAREGVSCAGLGNIRGRRGELVGKARLVEGVG